MSWFSKFIKKDPFKGTQILAREIAISELNDDEVDDLCKKAGIEIRCVSKNVSKDIQWLFGWVIRNKGRYSYTYGGVTKREIYNHLMRKEND
jgi:hypothetical protein